MRFTGGNRWKISNRTTYRRGLRIDSPTGPEILYRVKRQMVLHSYD